MIVTNDHALSWDGKQIAATGITLPLPKNIRSAATGEHDFKHFPERLNGLPEEFLKALFGALGISDYRT
jgi:hypothetical protein